MPSLSTHVAITRNHEQPRHVWASTVLTGALTVSSISNAKTIHELLHVVDSNDDLVQILPCFETSGAVDVVGEIKSLILNFLMCPVFFAMNLVCSCCEPKQLQCIMVFLENIPRPIFSACSDLLHIIGT